MLTLTLARWESRLANPNPNPHPNPNPNPDPNPNPNPNSNPNPNPNQQSQDSILLRYAYEGGSLSQGRLCLIAPEPDGTVTGRTLLSALKADGVDLLRFYPCACPNP